MTNEKSLGRPFAVITGASTGIGYELAKVFATEGHDLMVVAEDERIFTAAEEFSQLGVEVHPVVQDLSTRLGAEAFYQKILDHGRPVDALALNAGVGVGGEFLETDLDKELAMMNLNMTADVILSKKVLRDMVARGEGRILFTSSIAAEMAGPYYAVYAATKAFIQSFAIALRHEVKDKGVVVTALQPGATDTEFFRRADMLDTPAGQHAKDDPAVVARQGYDALMDGKAHVVAGSLMNKVNVASSKLISEELGAKMQARETKPSSVH